MKQYRPTINQLCAVFANSDIKIDKFNSVESIELIDFNTFKIHLKGGKRIPFSNLTERKFLNIINKNTDSDEILVYKMFKKKISSYISMNPLDFFLSYNSLKLPLDKEIDDETLIKYKNYKIKEMKSLLIKFKQKISK